MPITNMPFAVQMQNQDFLSLHKQANLGFDFSFVPLCTEVIKMCVKVLCGACSFIQFIRVLLKWLLFAQPVTYSLTTYSIMYGVH